MGFIESLENRQHLNADISAPFDGALYNPAAVRDTLYAQFYPRKIGHGVQVASVNVKSNRRFLVQDARGKTMEFGSNVLIKNVQNHAIIRDENRLWIVDEEAERAQPLFIDPKPFDDTPAQVIFFHGKSLTFAARSADGARLFAPTSDDLRHAVIDFAKLDAHTRITSVTPWQDELIIQLSDGAIFRSDGSQHGTTRLRGFTGHPAVVGSRLLLSHPINGGLEVIVTESNDLAPERRFTVGSNMTQISWTSGDRAILGFGADFEYFDFTTRRAADIVLSVPQPLSNPTVFKGALYMATASGWLRIDSSHPSPIQLANQTDFGGNVLSDGRHVFTTGASSSKTSGHFEIWQSDGTPTGTMRVAYSDHHAQLAGGSIYYLLGAMSHAADHFSVIEPNL